MTIEQETRSVLIADEGKIFIKKKSGAIAGTRVSLGYNYYDSGIALSKPQLETPDDYEEIDAPEDYEAPVIINQAKRMKRMLELIEKEKQEFQDRGLTAEAMLDVKALAPVWGKDIKEGDVVKKGIKFLYTPEGESEPRLYSVLQEHTVLAHYYPSVNTASLYVEVTPEFTESGEEFGTIDNPIEYNNNMILENGKYYTQYDIIYLCNRDSEIAVYNDLIDLVGIYVEEVV